MSAADPIGHITYGLMLAECTREDRLLVATTDLRALLDERAALRADLAALRKAARAYMATQWDMDELRREGAEGGKFFAAANRAQCEAIEAISKLLSQPSE